ncbi:MAG TPA: class I SAM-dependent methyltransferase [Magnetospirillum sp.]|nr:class I SAM-dependent methyltransferase [Magnetospirillum sp.]
MIRDQLRQLAAAGRFDAVLRAAAGLPDDYGAAALFRQGAAALKRNDAFAAVAAFEQAQALEPDFPALAEALASAYRRDARYHDAVRVTEGATGRQCRYERALSLLALGEGEAALAVLDAILADDPDHAVSWFASHAPALELHGSDEARRRLERATACVGANGKYWGFVAAYAVLAGEAGADELIRTHVVPHPARRALVDGVRALLPHCPQPPRLFGLSASLLRFAMAQAMGQGMVLEFGVRRGTSITVLAEVAGQQVHGFDSFEGLPQSWGSEPAGVLTTGAVLPQVPANVRLHAGWFEDTLQPFLAAHSGPVRLVNIDSDIYASARFVLTSLADRIRPGTVLVFDEFIGNRTWAEDEFKAFSEYVAETGVGWRVLALAPFTKQVAIEIL